MVAKRTAKPTTTAKPAAPKGMGNTATQPTTGAPATAANLAGVVAPAAPKRTRKATTTTPAAPVAQAAPATQPTTTKGAAALAWLVANPGPHAVKHIEDGCGFKYCTLAGLLNAMARNSAVTGVYAATAMVGTRAYKGFAYKAPASK
jgi:hypothetical protein